MPPCQATFKVAEFQTNEHGKLDVMKCPTCQGLFLRRQDMDEFDMRRWVDPDEIVAGRLANEIGSRSVQRKP